MGRRVRVEIWRAMLVRGTRFLAFSRPSTHLCMINRLARGVFGESMNHA